MSNVSNHIYIIITYYVLVLFETYIEYFCEVFTLKYFNIRIYFDLKRNIETFEIKYFPERDAF